MLQTSVRFELRNGRGFIVRRPAPRSRSIPDADRARGRLGRALLPAGFAQQPVCEGGDSCAWLALRGDSKGVDQVRSGLEGQQPFDLAFAEHEVSNQSVSDPDSPAGLDGG